MQMPPEVFATEHPLTTDKDISSEAFWHRTFPERDETFCWLRKNAPVSWHKPLEDPELPPEVHGEAGFWAVVRAADIQYVSQNNELFSSEIGSVMVRPRHPDFMPPPTFLEMDPPRHTRFRQIMSAGFTPKSVARLTGKINQRAAQIVDRVVGAGKIDFVTEVAAKLPMLTIADMIGVPDSLSETFAQAGDNFIGARDPEILPPGVQPNDFVLQQMGVLRQIGVDLVNHRRQHPSSDIATALANAELDGSKLTDEDITSVMLLLSVAGNDTTKQTTTSTVISLDRNPGQRAWLMEDFDGRIAGSIEEFIRHASPVIEFIRTATQDTELAGQQITKGDKVTIFYCSGNRDESLFPDPHRFSLARPPRPAHVAFGGGGVHFCLGNGIAKAQLRALFSNILTKLSSMEVGEPEYLYSEFINGVRHLPVTIN
jgi:cytochrome P450